MGINEPESNEVALQINQMLDPESKAVLDPAPSVIKKNISFQGLSWTKCVKTLWTFKADDLSK